MAESRRKTDKAPATAADTAAPEGEAKPAGKRSWLKFAIIGIAVLAIAGGVGAWLLLRHAKPKVSKPVAPVAVGPAVYISLDPPFVTNIESDQAERLLQITAQVMTHDVPTSELVKANDPVIRNDLLLLFSDQKYTNISVVAGKEQLRAAALEVVRHAISTAGGKPEQVEAIYFTSFVLQ